MTITTSSSKAQNRELAVWFQKIKDGTIKLPRFQRFEAWDRGRIKSFFNTIIYNLPVGITLLLEVGDREKFISRSLTTAPETESRVAEHLLDGQQRLTVFWRLMHNNYEYETYFIYIPEFDKVDDSIESDEVFVYCQPRWMRKERKYPLWADNPKECFRRGLLPTNLLQPSDISSKIEDWITQATQHLKPVSGSEDFEREFEEWFEVKKQLSARITHFREVVTHFNLPFLALPTSTPKETALRVFINMNTNSKPLSLYDIIVAEVESVHGESLHQLQEHLEARCPLLSHYGGTSQVLLATSALLQNKLPNERGMIEMDKTVMVERWDVLERGISQMTSFLNSQGIYDQQRLPTNAVLSIIAALYSIIPDSGDARGSAETLLMKYLWSSFFTDRYENTAATRAFADYRALNRVLLGEKKDSGEPYAESDVPVLDRDENPLPTIQSLVTAGWPKKQTILGRGILAVTTYLGAYDFADGRPLTPENVGTREYHHIFPDALLQEAGLGSFLALNCALISGRTNRDIGRKDPLKYLKERYEWSDESIVHQRLNSHLIPIEELAHGGYEDEELGDTEKSEKIQSDFRAFLHKRAALVSRAIDALTQGKQITASEIV